MNSKLEDYLGKVHGILIAAEESLSSQQLTESWHLVDHGEPAEGLSSLAWTIVEDDVQVSPFVIDGIRKLTAGMVDPDDLPPNLDYHAHS